MAEFSFVPGFAGEATVTAALVAASSAEIILGPNAYFYVTASAVLNIAFGLSGMSAASAANFQLPANSLVMLTTGDHYDRIRVFGTATYWIQKVDKA